MKMNYKLMAGFFIVIAGSVAIGCKPKTLAQKVEDKAEDARHEVGQGMERAGERVKDGK